MFVYIWEYHVKNISQPEFENIYGPDGKWVRLFKQAEGYHKTELHRDIENKNRYITIDYWASKSAFDKFRKKYANKFEALDTECENLTEKEISHGEFESLIAD